MTYIWLALGWFIGLFTAFLTLSMLILRNWLRVLILAPAAVLSLPPVYALLENTFDIWIHPYTRGLIVFALLAIFIKPLLKRKSTSIYKTPELKAQFLEIYDQKMADWPVPYEDVFIETQYGTVHVLVSGPEDAETRPILLLHASGVASWSWKYNIEALSQHARVYAIDLIGDAGKSEYASMDNVMKNGEDQASLYTEITNKLGVSRACVVGASEGGFIGTNYALHAPSRVEKLVLLGPMGYSGALKSVARITVAQMYPLKPIQENTVRWAFSDSDVLLEDLREWFMLLMSGVFPAKVPPLAFLPEERQALRVPVLFVFGQRDHLVGNPEVAQKKVQDIPNVRVEIVDAGHLMAAEQPETINRLILEFLQE